MAQDCERLIASDDIDLIELIKGLWQQKMLIMVTTAVIFLSALAYALLARPAYEAKVFVQPRRRMTSHTSTMGAAPTPG